MAQPERPKPHQSKEPAPPLSRLTDDLLADILIRLPMLADLGRAAAACPTFRRVIASRSFLRRIRAVHPPLLIGTLSGHCGPDFLPAQPPHPSAGVARAFADAADFSCSFLPSPDRWRYRDFRDGRALLSRAPDNSILPRGDYDRFTLVKDLAICNLLHRRYLLLPAIPDDLAALADEQGIRKFEPFLAPYMGNEHEGGTSFKVICLAECRYESKLVVFTFASRDGQWHAAEFDGWKALTAAPANRSPTFAPPELSRRDFAHGCFCWVMRERKKLLVLDTHTMEFSSFDTPPVGRPHGSAIVEAGEGRFGMFTICFDRGSGTYNLLYTVLRDEIQSSNQWKSDATIQLPVNYDYNILGVAGGYLLLLGILHGHHHNLIIPISERPNMDCFTLNLRTFLIQPFCSTKCFIEDAPLYAGFPPSLSLPGI
jgi:hypothetical protein